MISAVLRFGKPRQPPSQTGSERTGAAIAIGAEDINMVFNPQTQPFQALKSVQLQVPTGTVQMIVGPSGAGKTTLLLILAGLLTPTSGRIQLLGETITALSPAQLTEFRLRHIGLLFEESNLLRALTALENVEVVLTMKGMSQKAARRRAQELLAAVGLGDRAKHLPHQLSGGQLQRVAIARALAGQPDLLIADEPTSALDSKNGQIVVELMRNLAQEQGCTVIIATHDPRIIPVADRVAHLEDGVLTAAQPNL